MSSVLSTPIVSKFASSHSLVSARPRSRNCFEERPGDVVLGRRAEGFEPAGAADAMQPLLAVFVASQHAGADEAGDEVGGPELGQQAGVEGDLVGAVSDLVGRDEASPRVRSG